MPKPLKTALNVLKRIVLSVLLLLVLLWAFLLTDFGQNWLVQRVTSKLSGDLQTKISIRHIGIGFFNRLDLDGVYVEDQKKDTLLYAGQMNVRITDWFFFKDKATLEYIGLRDAVVHLNRTDSVWNYNFLSAYFASGDTTKTQTPTKDAGIQFDLKRVELSNVNFIKKDPWLGSDLSVRFSTFNLDADEISGAKKTVRINNIELADPWFSSLSYQGQRKSTPGAPFDWDIRIASISLTNGRYQQHKDSLTARLRGFDGAHMDFRNINGTVKNFSIRKNTITATAALSTAERSGFTVKQLNTQLTISPTAWVFDKLLLQTPHSKLADRFTMKFESTKSFSDFIHAVTMEANFNQASISSTDLAYFIPAAEGWKKNIRINGYVEGAVDGLSSDALQIWTGRNTYVNGSISVVGLPDMNKTLINVDAKDLKTTYADALDFFPALRRVTSPNVRALQYLDFKGTFTGFMNDFVSYGTLRTALGTITTDINMKLPKNGDAVYSGTIATNGFELGTLTNNRQLGVVDFTGSVKGRSFDYNRMALDVDGNVRRIRYGTYTYQNITAKGKLTSRQLNGDFVIKDPNADLRLTGLVDFSGATPLFDATAQINRANLKALQLTKDDIRLRGDFNLNLQGSNLENLLGSARISGAELIANGQKLSFDFLNVASYTINGERNLSVSSNEFDGKITGDFDIATLPSAFRLFLTRYYPAYIKPPTSVRPQDFSFDITTGLVEDYIKLLNKDFTGFNNSRITGSLRTAANTMTIDADVPLFGYKQYNFTDVKLKGAGDLDSLVLTGSITDAALGGGVVLPQTSFRMNASRDVTALVLNTTSNQAVNSAALAARINTYSDGATILFSPSSFVLNGKTWSIEQGGELNFRKSSVTNGQLVLKQGDQEVDIRTVASDIGDWSDLQITLQRLNLGDLSPLLLKNMRVEGLLSGNIVLENPTEKLVVNAALQAGALQVDADSIGDVAITGRYDNLTGMLTGRGNNLDPDHKIDFDLAMNLQDSANLFRDRISLRPTNFQLKILERFLGTLFRDIQGYTTGAVDILGEGSRRDFVGKLRLTNAGMKVVFTQVFYTIEDTDFELKADYLDLNGLFLRDRKGNRAKISGGISHQGFQNMQFDLAVETVSPQMELINTTYRDNQQFYGRAWGSGSFVLLGPQYDMNMYIDVKASATDSSFVTLPPAQTRETGISTFLVEKKYGREMTESERRGGLSNMTYEVNLTATPLVNVEMILDEATGDIIRGRGNGNLKITSGTTAPLRLSGRYNIEEGAYNFTFQSVFKRPFIVRKGANNYIEWNGDPYDANVNLEAYYTAERVSFAPLASTLLDQSTSASRNLLQLRDNVNVAAKLTGKLFTPNIDFKLEFPGNSQIFSDPSIAFAIQQLERNTNELTKQVTFLVVTNSFAPYESGQAVQRPFEQLTYNTISGLLYNQINKQLNQIFAKILRNNKFTLNFSGSLYNRNLIDPNAGGLRLLPNQASSTLSVGGPIFNGRAILTVGGNFEVGWETNIQQTFQLLPDVTLEVLLNKTGTLRATFFYRQNIDYLNGFTATNNSQVSRIGSSISYSKDFDSFGEWLLGKRKKPAQPTLPVDSTAKPSVVVNGSEK